MIFEQIRKYFGKSKKNFDENILKDILEEVAEVETEFNNNTNYGFSSKLVQSAGNVQIKPSPPSAQLLSSLRSAQYSNTSVISAAITGATSLQSIAAINNGAGAGAGYSTLYGGPTPGNNYGYTLSGVIGSPYSSTNRIICNFGPATQKLFFQIHGETIPRGDSFNDLGAYYIIEHPLDKHYPRLFHFKVWKIINEHINDFGLIYIEDRGMHIAFNTVESKDSYLEWMSDYKNRFFQDVDMDVYLIPPLPEGNLDGVFLRGLFNEKSDELTYSPGPNIDCLLYTSPSPRD